MKKKILVIQGSDINKINYKTDTSVFLGLEAQRRKFDIFYYEPKHLGFKNGQIFAECFKIKIINNSKKIVTYEKIIQYDQVKKTSCHSRRV